MSKNVNFPGGQFEIISFQGALSVVKTGRKVYRLSSPKQFIVMMDGMELEANSAMTMQGRVNDKTAKFVGKDTAISTKPYLVMYDRSTNEWHIGWTPSQEDLFALDWEEYIDPAEVQ